MSSSSRPVHPAYVPVFPATGVELSCWAYVTHSSSSSPSCYPNLVTAQGSTVLVYRYDPDRPTRRLSLVRDYQVSGSVCSLDRLVDGRRVNGALYDGLLLGFAGAPRLSVVWPTRRRLTPSSIVDLTAPLHERCRGATTPTEQDLMAAVRGTTAAVVLGGGVCVAVFDLLKGATPDSENQDDWWSYASEPYLVDLHALSRGVESSDGGGATGGGGTAATQLTNSKYHTHRDQQRLNPPSTQPPTSSTQQASNTAPLSYEDTLPSGWGEVLSLCFLPRYSSPVLSILHTSAAQVCAGRTVASSAARHACRVTTLSVEVERKRAVVLSSHRSLPCDSRYLVPAGRDGCVVVSVNGLVRVDGSNGGTDTLTVNGLAGSTTQRPRRNAHPLPLPTLQLDGSRLAFLEDDVALLACRNGKVYVVELSHGEDDHANKTRISCTPSPFRLEHGPTATLSVWKNGHNGDNLLFCGSRMGDSVLLQYEDVKRVTLGRCLREDDNDTDTISNNNNNKRKRSHLLLESGEEVTSTTLAKTVKTEPEDERDRLLRQEEAELYAGYTDATDSHYISDHEPDDPDKTTTTTMTTTTHDNAVFTLSLLPSLTTLHTLTAPGPLGPGCRAPSHRKGEEVHVLPCGHGSSGGVAVIRPVVDGRNVVSEVDVRGVEGGWCCEKMGLLVFGREREGSSSGGLVLQWGNNGGGAGDDGGGGGVLMEEIRVGDGSSSSSSEDDKSRYTPRQVLSESTVLSVKEWCVHDNVCMVMIVTNIGDATDDKYTVAILQQQQQQTDTTPSQAKNMALDVVFCYELQQQADSGSPPNKLVSLTTLEEPQHSDGNALVFGCVWENGTATLHMIHHGKETHDWTLTDTPVPSSDDGDDPVTAMDIFTVDDRCGRVFASPPPKDAATVTEQQGDDVAMDQVEKKDDEGNNANTTSSQEDSTFADEVFDADDLELYGMSSSSGRSIVPHHGAADTTTAAAPCRYLRVAVCRASSALEVYDTGGGMTCRLSPVWCSHGCGHGVPTLVAGASGADSTPPDDTMACGVAEVRFFCCGDDDDRPCCAVLTRNADLSVYTVEEEDNDNTTVLHRVQLGHVVTRPSMEEGKHRAKLARKGLSPATTRTTFRRPRLHRFENVSGQRGLFAATSRPLWIVDCGGRIVALWHKMRHLAPAGVKDVPVAAFFALSGSRRDRESMSLVPQQQQQQGGGCDGGFLTVHERIGRVGSQRLTVFNGIFGLPSQDNGTFYPHGSGMLLNKIPFGVTVRRIAYLDHANLSTTTHPVFLLLISRELELDQASFNDDGLTPEERQYVKDEKEREKTRRQVEADLGGFDVEQEWVEEIEREDCFEVEEGLGGAPKIHVEKHEVWLVRGGESWAVLDTHALKDFEHGMTLRVTPLSDVSDDGPPGQTDPTSDGTGATSSSQLFVAVGTGIVDQDGEDISSKGRVLLFEVLRANKNTNTNNAELRNEEDAERSPSMRLSLTYEKDILLGPVASIGCLACDGKSRLVIGAGAEVTVEQWGEGKLTQVGFFHANMQVQDIVLFKTFFLLSDAYDSLHFLVWRESDKSLTLLAKDYEPTPVYAAGVLSRGGSMSFVCHDDRQNFQFFQYAPKDEAARGGNKLVCRADFHVGTQTISLENHWCQSSLLVSSSTPHSTLTALKIQDSLFGRGEDDARFAVHFGTTDGSFSSVVPVNERVYWRLTALQSVLSNALESNCALSARAWRLYRRAPRRGGCRSNDRKKGVLDGALLFQFLDLGIAEQEQLASAIGSTVPMILDNLLELECASRV